MMPVFETLAIDHTSIPQKELDIEEKSRSNLFSWTGQFSPQFVETLLNYYAKEGDILLDPFAGSGTLLYEAARKGLAAFGMELNVSAYFLAKTYELVNASIERRQKLIEETEQTLASLPESEARYDDLVKIIRKKAPSVLSNLLSTLLILSDSNIKEQSLSLLGKKWEKLRQIILDLPFSTAPIQVRQGDSRNLGSSFEKATLLITPPPYINVFNYHQQYRQAAEALGYDVLALARSEVGSNRKNRANRLLTVVQYCIDMALSIREAIGCCQKEARMIYVVGRESKVLGYSFCNSRLIYEIATEIFGLSCLLRQERAFKNRYGQIIYEDILHFQNTGKLHFDESDIEKAARSIALRALEETARNFPDSSRIELVYEAMEKAEKVQRSKVFEPQSLQ